MPTTTTFSLNRSIGGAIAAIAIVSFIASVAVSLALSDLRDAMDMRARTFRIIRALGAFQIAMFDQETGIQGYLLTGRESSLEPYTAGRPALDAASKTLHSYLDGEPREAELLGFAEDAARAWQSTVAAPVIRAMTDPATRAAAHDLESQGEGKRRFDTFREKLGAIEAVQDEELGRQNDLVAGASRHAAEAVWTGALVVLAIALAIAIAIGRIIVQPLIRLAEAMGRLAQRDLTAAVPHTGGRSEIGAMARAVQVFKIGLIELDRTSLLRATADTLPAMVGYVDARRRVGFLNGEFGRWFDLGVEDVAEATGRPLAQVFSRQAFPGATEGLEAAFAGREARFEHRLVRPGSERRAFEAFYRPHRAPDGQVLGVVTLLTDITDRKRMEIRLAQHTRDLRRSNEELEQFAYVASHDLKAPLRGIDNLVTWIEEDLEGSLTGDVATNMTLLKSRVRRLENLLDDLLAYSRAGRSEAATDQVDTRLLVEELAGLVGPPEGFSITGSPELPTLQAARAPLTQVLQNLISNAIKHHDHPATGHVVITAAEAGPMIAFVVTDDGPGVPTQFRERVFGMFQTLRPRDEVEGSGMGLAIVKKLVERQGGTIWLADAAEGRGLAVHFTWPTGEKESTDGTDRELAAG